jgi:hypothetical protein
MITIIPESSVARFSPVIFLRDAPCHKLHELWNGLRIIVVTDK